MILQEDEALTAGTLAKIGVDEAIERFINTDVIVEDF